MTEPAPSGGPSPLRVGGLALLGAGVVAALIGLATLLPGSGGASGETTTAVAAPPVTDTAQVAPPPAPGTPVPATSAVPVPSFPVSTQAVAAPPVAPVAPAAPGTGAGGTGNGAGGAGAGSGGGAPVGQRGAVRVYNNSKITGLAAHAADDFRNDGWKVEQVSNYPSGTIATSTVYYRPGTAEQSAATRLAGEFGLRVEPRFNGIDDASPGLIVIVTNDYQKR